MNGGWLGNVCEFAGGVIGLAEHLPTPQAGLFELLQGSMIEEESHGVEAIGFLLGFNDV
jgi:hypothetical protein